MTQTDSDAYRAKKRFLKNILTIYGRKPVQEALSDKNLTPYRLHLADSNRSAAVLEEICALAEQRNVDIQYHDRQALSRISRNGKQDQGIALDIHCPAFCDYQDFITSAPDDSWDIIALDRVTNPQNLGMIVRSICAAGTQGLLLPEKGCARLDALVIKASAGTLFRAPILRCSQLTTALKDFRQAGANIYTLDADASQQLGQLPAGGRNIFILGNETEGVSPEVTRLCNAEVSIPMQNNVESLNVAVTASLVAFRQQLL